MKTATMEQPFVGIVCLMPPPASPDPFYSFEEMLAWINANSATKSIWHVRADMYRKASEFGGQGTIWRGEHERVTQKGDVRSIECPATRLEALYAMYNPCRAEVSS